MSRSRAFTDEQFKDAFMKLLFRHDGSRRSFREISESAILLRLTKWSKTSKSHLGSLARQLQRMKFGEYEIFLEAKRRFLIPQHMEFSDFSNNKKLNYEKPTEESTLSKSIPKNKRLKELCFRLGVTDEDIDISVLTEDEVYEFLHAMGYTQVDIDKINEDIKNIRYIGK